MSLLQPVCYNKVTTWKGVSKETYVLIASLLTPLYLLLRFRLYHTERVFSLFYHTIALVVQWLSTWLCYLQEPGFETHPLYQLLRCGCTIQKEYLAYLRIAKKLISLSIVASKESKKCLLNRGKFWQACKKTVLLISLIFSIFIVTVSKRELSTKTTHWSVSSDCSWRHCY